MRRIRNSVTLLFLIGLILYLDVSPTTQIRRCYADWRRCANGTCTDPILPDGVPTCDNLCRPDAVSKGCCSGYSGIEPTLGCGNPGADCEGNTYNKLVVFKQCQCDGTCNRDIDGDGYSPDDPEPDGDCDDSDPDIHPGVTPTCDSGFGQDFNCDGIDDLSQCDSPIVIDVAGDGFALTDARDGVLFDLDGDGVRERLSWTASGSDDAWLVLDRNQNGQVDGGDELFGNFTPQPPSTYPNGFLALAVFDRTDAGGNGDAWIGRADSVFAQLRLWRDGNHDGLSQPDELRSLRDAGISGISTEYRESGRRDCWGNRFRYQAKVLDEKRAHIGQWAYDVFLVTSPGGQAR